MEAGYPKSMVDPAERNPGPTPESIGSMETAMTMPRTLPYTPLLTLGLVGALLGAQSFPAAAQEQETTVTVRVLAHDAKLIGSGVGGAAVSIRDAATGELLAKGVHQGGTGDTNLIMREPADRGATRLATEGAAAFSATLSLAGPTRVEIHAEAPLGSPPEERVRATRTLLLLPGQDVVGEGIVMELYGFTVGILAPEDGGAWDGTVRARITMLCGCPTEPGGLWDADRYSVWAEFETEGGEVHRVDLAFAGETSQYSGVFRELEGSDAMGTLTVFASDSERGNFGMSRRTVGR